MPLAQEGPVSRELSGIQDFRQPGFLPGKNGDFYPAFRDHNPRRQVRGFGGLNRFPIGDEAFEFGGDAWQIRPEEPFPDGRELIIRQFEHPGYLGDAVVGISFGFLPVEDLLELRVRLFLFGAEVQFEPGAGAPARPQDIEGMGIRTFRPIIRVGEQRREKLLGLARCQAKAAGEFMGSHAGIMPEHGASGHLPGFVPGGILRGGGIRRPGILGCDGFRVPWQGCSDGRSPRTGGRQRQFRRTTGRAPGRFLPRGKPGNGHSNPEGEAGEGKNQGAWGGAVQRFKTGATRDQCPGLIPAMQAASVATLPVAEESPHPSMTPEVSESNSEDIRLMRATAAGDDHAFRRLVEKHQGSVIGTIAKMTGRPSEAEDLAQQVFVRVWKSAPRYEPSAKFTTWLFTIVRNLVFNESRRTYRKHEVSMEAQVEQSHCETADHVTPLPDTMVLHDELREAADKAIAALPEQARMAVILRRFEDTPYEEIAAVLGTTVPAVKSLLFRARIQIRESLRAYLEDE